MAEVIEIRIVQSGAGDTANKIERVGTAAKRTENTLDTLRAALGLFAAQRLIRGFVTLADTFTLLQNRVRVFVPDSREAAARLDDLADIAVRTRTTLEGVGTTFQRFSLIAREAGISSKETAEIVETLSKSIIVSGATSQEAEGALRQFAQGIAANRLSGQELNAVLEQTPRIAQLIADELGITVGSLRASSQAASRAGKTFIDANTALRAIKNGAAGINEEFSRIAPTIGQAATVFRTGLTVLVGKLNETSGIGATAARVLINMGESMLTAAKNAKVLAVASGVLAAAITGITIAVTGLATRAIPAMVARLGGLGLALGPVGVAVTAAVGAFIALKDVVFDFGRVQEATLGDIAAVIGGDLVNTVSRLARKFGELLDFDGNPILLFFKGLVLEIGEFLERFDIIERAAERFRERTGETEGGGRTRPKPTDGLSDELKETLADFKVFQKEVVATSEFQEFAVESLERYSEAIKEFTPLVEEGAITQQELNATMASFAEKEANDAATAMADFLSSIDPTLAAVRDFKGDMVLLKEIFQAGLIPEERFEELKRLRELIFLEDVEESFNLDAIQGFHNQLVEGFKASMRTIRDEIGSTAEVIRDGFTNAFNIAGNAITEFVTTGKADFRGFAVSILAELQKVILKLIVVLILKKLAGSTLPGAGIADALLKGVSSGAPVTGKQRGGGVSPGRSFIVGERGPELFSPPQTGRVVPNDQLGGAAPQVNVQIVNVDDPNSVPDALTTKQGEQAVLNVLSRNRGRARQAIS